MLKNMLNKQATMRLLVARRSFASINEHSINLASVSPKDVHESSPKAVGALMAALAKNPKSENEGALCNEIDEYFRQKFRKVTFEDAKAIVSGLGFDSSYSGEKPVKIDGLDDKFWVWETLEEATRPHVDEISKDEFQRFITGWSMQMKGSEELYDLMQERVFYFYAEGPPF